MSRRRSVASTTRLANVGQSSGRTAPAKASAWKYSSTSNVNTLFICTDLGQGRVVGLLTFRQGLDYARESGDERDPRYVAQELGGAAGLGLPRFRDGGGLGPGTGNWRQAQEPTQDGQDLLDRRGLPRAHVDRLAGRRCCRRGGHRGIHGVVPVGEVESRRGIGIQDGGGPGPRIDES